MTTIAHLLTSYSTALLNYLTMRFSENGIAKIIPNLDPNKAHGHDEISIRMLKIGLNTISKRLECIFHISG